MTTSIRTSTQKARKDYNCNACEGLTDIMSRRGNPFTFTEWRAIAKAKNQGWKILKGQIYEYQFNTDGGDTWSFRGIPEIVAICQKYNVWDDY